MNSRKLFVLISLFLFLSGAALTFAASDIKYSYLNKAHTNVQAEFVLDAPVEKIWGFLVAYDEHGKVLPNIKKVTIIEQRKGGKVTETVVQSGPFEIKYKSLVQEDRKDYYMHWDQTEGPFDVFSGSWKLEPIDSNSTKICYKIHIEHKLMPAAVKNSLIKGSIPDMRKSLQNHLE